MASNFIVDVNEADFEYEVLAFSQKTPVVVDFWAEWCLPCKVLGPVLERLANEAGGAFRLAKVNSDENPALAQRFGVRGIPSVKAFRDGAVVAEFTGVQPEARLREFLGELVPSQSDLLLEKGRSLLEQGDLRQAEASFREVLDQKPENTEARLGLAKCLLLQGEAQESYSLLRQFPPSRQYPRAEILLPFAQALRELKGMQELPDDPLQAAYFNAVRLAGRGNLEAGLDGLLDILRQDRRHRDGGTRKVFLSLLELLGEQNPTARQYRNELAAVLF